MVWLNWYAKTTFYPGLVDPINQGGLGFDYYVNVSPTEMWPFLIEKVPLQDWSVAEASSSIPDLIPLHLAQQLELIALLEFTILYYKRISILGCYNVLGTQLFMLTL
jgi:hypothetical protein